ncbi:enterochelin esterase [Pseudomonas oryzihabitans]|uniref:enterochelin esterase n=1 Tax=Pseudomonas oryzihabitans TaxID=47885 RepID=UPI002893E281|nr:enterochelin esterase [Pseudomonas oryzihabitans]MDT3717944.1 enterochelin esterase [Pseudomonas oryzihabitans]
MNDSLFQRDDLGSEPWWQAVAQRGTPLIEPTVGGRYRLTFLWRDPAGVASGTQRVWLNVTGVTDHHQPGLPQSLQRLPGTDVWAWEIELDGRWRGSYCLIPTDEPAHFEDVAQPDLQGIRLWWRSVFPLAQSDRLNPRRAWQGGRGLAVSGVHLPEATPQSAWAGFDAAVDAPTIVSPRLQQQRWDSARLGNSRTVWWFTTGNTAPEERPLAILLDGQFWAQTMPVGAPLQWLTDAGQLPEAVYLLIDNSDRALRSRELPCNPEFWLAVQEELLPQVRAWVPHAQASASTVVAGQSFGGLAALYAALHWPERFGCALSQSGSFWWPQRGAPGRLFEALEAGQGTGQPLRLFIEAGLREPAILEASRALVPRLREQGHALDYREIDGGHDALWWRGGLLDGLVRLWQPLPTRHPDR